MIEKISINNYKSINSLSDFELKPVNVLIGANNSGKSNFLDVFAFLRDTLHDNNQIDSQGNKEVGWQSALQKRGKVENLGFKKATSFNISCFTEKLRYYLRIDQNPSTLSDQIGDEQFTSIFNLGQKYFSLSDGNITIYDDAGNHLKTSPLKQSTALGEFLKLMKTFNRQNRGDKHAFEFVQELSKVRIYDRIHTEIWSPIRTSKAPMGETILDEDGGNLAGVLQQLSEDYPGFRDELESLLKILFDDFVRISFHHSYGRILIRWENADGQVTNTLQLSDGTLKFLCIIAILKNPKPPALIGIDEVDANLHPKMQEIVANMIDEASKRTQIVVTTHNPDFVSMFSPEQVVILQKYKGMTEMRRFSDKGALDLWLKDFTTRELWLMGELESRW